MDRYPAFGIQLPERDVKRPLRGADLAQAIQGKIDSLADANSGGADEQQDVVLLMTGPLIQLRPLPMGLTLACYQGPSHHTCRSLTWKEAWLLGIVSESPHL
jgi:hypothetical protein